MKNSGRVIQHLVLVKECSTHFHYTPESSGVFEYYTFPIPRRVRLVANPQLPTAPTSFSWISRKMHDLDLESVGAGKDAESYCLHLFVEPYTQRTDMSEETTNTGVLEVTLRQANTGQAQI